MALPMQKRFSVFNEVYLVNHLRDILDYSCKWLVFKYSFRCKGPKNAFGFTLKATLFGYTQYCLCLTEEIKKAAGPFYLV